ncbi:HK97 family phage prohead protease [Comamonas sp.]|uniref:HK97 family phage prohead protease n=1 Tax=Comamonas sp. TaxID=34028 RepID=UPI002896AB34|nr:HK97 family phage prohead protease [Comamonas sp.]
MQGICKTLNFEDAEIKFVGGDSVGTFEGYASVFGVTDSDGDVIRPGAFKSALHGRRPMRDVAMFFNHRKFDVPIGRWTELTEDSKGLYAKGELTPGHAQADMIRAAMKHGTVGGMSVGFTFTNEGFTKSATGREFINVASLREISLCTFPANEQAQITSMKALDSIESIRDCESWLRDVALLSKSDAQAFMARVKSATLRDSGGRDELTALVECIRKSPL